MENAYVEVQKHFAVISASIPRVPKNTVANAAMRVERHNFAQAAGVSIPVHEAHLSSVLVVV